MTAMAFDTHRAVKSLIGQGVPPDQAEVFVDVISNSRSFDVSELATRAELKQEIGLLRSDLHREIATLRGEVKTDIAELKAEIMKWMFGGFLTVIGLLITMLMKIQ